MTHAATSKVENSAQGLSCKLKFVHGFILLFGEYLEAPLGDSLAMGIDDNTYTYKFWKLDPGLIL